MKLIQHTDQALTMQMKPWLLWLLSGMSVLIGLAVLMLFSSITTLRCQKILAAATCIIQTTRWLSQPEAVKLAVIQGAYVETSHYGNGYTYRVQIRTGDGTIPFTLAYSSGYDAKHAIVAQLESFLHRPQQTSISLVDDHRWLGYSLSSVFILSATLITALLGNVVTCTFDRSCDRVTLYQQGLLGKTINYYSLGQVVEIHIEVSQGSISDSYCLCLRVASDRTSTQSEVQSEAHITTQLVPLASYFSAGQSEIDEAGERICQFLHLEKPKATHPSETRWAIAHLIHLWESLHTESR